MKVLVTGTAGFIGFHLAQRLLQDGMQVYGVDNLNEYYAVSLKRDRLALLQPYSGFTFQALDLSDRDGVAALFQQQPFDCVVNLAAQAGIRYSLQNPWTYIDSNVSGFVNVLEGCRQQSIKHLVFASSSSVYGANTKVPFAESDRTDHPVSLYAATKKANELIAHTYSHLYALPMTGLRFFTVYGPWGRPDMAYFKFTRAILAGEAIDVYNFGKMQRDFTYIDDIIEGVVRVMRHPPQGVNSRVDLAEQPNSNAPYRVYNIGNNHPIELMTLIQTLEKAIGKEATLNLLPMQPGEVLTTYADVQALSTDLGFAPNTAIEEGIKRFVDWYQSYYH
ncbi:NAD-dependent epimerase [Phormidium sp. CLA17]|uniref:NAD-dependent epimerase n=1 Tax=Leptolyngbya sp. Cla-17 TaxID=2803751 RepID=UPI001490E910|nr:NAD-dependent epimerase [Leptolyngbya sp. Cla-17]MBM0742114.1 NAD-dependent epimerase [Leptolyngbya sp. Cla-17]